MHVLVATDLEGVSCVDSIDMMTRDTEGYELARRYLTEDTNAAVDGAFLGGATRVTVIDGHGGGNNLILDQLDPRAEVMESDEYCEHTPDYFDAVVGIGFHAMAGTENAFLDHTQSSKLYFDYCINGVPYGELAQGAFMQGFFGTPVVMVSGDAALCREAEALIPGIVTACTKEARGRNRAVCIPLEESLSLIRRSVAEGVERYREIKPLVLTLPAELSLTYCRNDYCDRFMHEGLERHGRTVKKTIEKVENYLDLVVL